MKAKAHSAVSQPRQLPLIVYAHTQATLAKIKEVHQLMRSSIADKALAMHEKYFPAALLQRRQRVAQAVG